MSNITFTSRLNPVKPFSIMTKNGEISVAEVDLDKELNSKLIKRINRFFCRNFSRDTNDAHYTRYRIGTPKERKEAELEFENNYRKIFNDKRLKDNTTLLVAKDSKNRIQGACLSSPCFMVPNSIDNTLWIDSLAVNKKYRNEQIASRLLDTTLDINKSTFTDVFLTGTNFAEKFYLKKGFKPLNPLDYGQFKLLELLSWRYDINKYVIPFTKILQPNKPR